MATPAELARDLAGELERSDTAFEWTDDMGWPAGLDADSLRISYERPSITQDGVDLIERFIRRAIDADRRLAADRKAG